MASKFNIKTVHNDGKTELTIGLDENQKIFDGEGENLIIKNKDGSYAKLSNENIIGMPDDVSENNKLVTQADLNAMKKQLETAIKAQVDSMASLVELAKIVGNINEEEQ